VQGFIGFEGVKSQKAIFMMTFTFILKIEVAGCSKILLDIYLPHTQEVPGLIPALPDFLRSSGSETGST
jgi:hypothetical protein